MTVEFTKDEAEKLLKYLDLAKNGQDLFWQGLYDNWKCKTFDPREQTAEIQHLQDKIQQELDKHN